MDCQEGLALVEEILGEPLSNLHSNIFRFSWEGKTYEGMSCEPETKYDSDYLKQQGSKIWDMMSDTVGDKVRKKNFKRVLERQKEQKQLLQEIDKDSQTPSIPFDPLFVGREQAIDDLNTMAKQGEKIILILGEGGVGKTSLAQQYIKHYDLEIVYQFLASPQDLTPEALVEDCLQRYFQEEPGREFGISLAKLRAKLLASPASICFLLDNLESTLKNGHFMPECQRYGELLRTLSDPALPTLTLLTSREPLYITGIKRYALSELSLEAWQEYLLYYGIEIGSNPLAENSTLSQLHRAYGGNAEFMHIISGTIEAECDGDLEDYWQQNSTDLLANPTLESFVQRQFEKLATDNSIAYKLLCRLGCYRYRDRLGESALAAMLWDVPSDRHRRLGRELYERALVKLANKKYYLHPVIQSVAIERLKASGEWETANRAAAAFWSGSVTQINEISDGLTALEAYYHYVSIDDFEMAGEVLLVGRPTHANSAKSRLGRSLYKLGAWQETIAAIAGILPKVQSPVTRVGLQDIFADLCWLTGDLQKALSCYAEVRQTLIALRVGDYGNLPSYMANVEIASYLYEGFCSIDLGEFSIARASFQQVLQLAKNTPQFRRFAVRAAYSLAFLATLDDNLKHEARSLLETYHDDLTQAQWGAWSGGFSLYFLGSTERNLGNLAEADVAFNRAIDVAGDRRYVTVKTKCLTGLAMTFRQGNDLEAALGKHEESIDLAEGVGARGDLAEALLQLAITLRQMGKLDEATDSFERSLQLFSQMDAPRQIDRVQGIMKQ